MSTGGINAAAMPATGPQPPMPQGAVPDTVAEQDVAPLIDTSVAAAETADTAEAAGTQQDPLAALATATAALADAVAALQVLAEQGATTATATSDVSGGGPGSGTGGAGQAAQGPVQCCTPAWVATDGSGRVVPVDPSDPSTPPEPMPIPTEPDGGIGDGTTSLPGDPGSDEAPIPVEPDGGIGDGATPVPGTDGSEPVATGPASSLPTWPRWNEEFAALGMAEAELQALGAQQLTDEQLAEIYVTISDELAGTGETPAADPTAPTGETGAVDMTGLPQTGGWSDEWAAAFESLGFTAEDVQAVGAEAQQRQMTDAELAEAYRALEAELAGAGQVPGQQDPAQQGGWNADFEARFRELGMPDSIIAMYAQSGATAEGLEAALAHVQERMQPFVEGDWFAKLEEVGFDAESTWSLVLADTKTDMAQVEAMYEFQKVSEVGGIRKFLSGKPLAPKGTPMLGSIRIPGALTLIPGGEFAQYFIGKRPNGETIDRTNPLNIGFAALSGLALVGTIKGVRNIGAGWAARGAKLPELAKAGLSTQGNAISDAGLGALQSWGAKEKALSLVPFTKQHSQVVALGQVERAAAQFNSGASSKLLSASDGKLQLTALGTLFDEIKTGAAPLIGPKNAYLPQIMKPAPMALGAEGIRISKALNATGNGSTQLAALSEVAGQRLAANPAWLDDALPGLSEALGRTSQAHLSGTGQVMAGSLVNTIGGIDQGGRVGRHFTTMSRGMAEGLPSWFTKLPGVNGAASAAAGAATASTAAGAATGAAASVADDATRSATASADEGLASAAGAADDGLVDPLTVADATRRLEAIRNGTLQPGMPG